MFEGAYTAIVTPFDRKGQVDYGKLRELIELQVAAGIDGIVPVGTTGESPTLDFSEHKLVIETAIKAAAGRIKVIAGTGANSTSEAVELTRFAAGAGADGSLQVTPYYNKPTQEGLYRHFSMVADIGLPIVLYNIPGRTGVELSPETIVRMYEEIPAVVAVKEATGKLDVSSQVAASCDITILSGDDSLTLPICSVGGSGVISVLANLLPAEIRKLCDFVISFDLADATMQHLRLFNLCRGMFVETNPIPIKAAMAMAGMIQNELRLPLSPLSEHLRPALRRQLEEFGIPLKQ